MESVSTLLDDSSEKWAASSSNCIAGTQPDILAAIYEETINIAVLQRSLSSGVTHYCQQLVDAQPAFNLRAAVQHDRAAQTLTASLPDLPDQHAFVEDLVQLMDMYACLFDLDEIGIRIQVLDRAMCPRFHTDKLGCRLVTTYRGAGTEWLRNADVDRSKLGTRSKGLSDSESGLLTNEQAVQQVNPGDVVLLKGDGWIGNEGLGAVHRSPAVQEGEQRVVVTMDFA